MNTAQDNEPLDFIDLKSQYAALRESINSRIQRVLDHGQYIMGPKVVELERKLCACSAVHYPKPLHHQPAYAALCCPECCPGSVEAGKQVAGKQVMSLPMSADLTAAQMDRVVAALENELSR